MSDDDLWRSTGASGGDASPEEPNSPSPPSAPAGDETQPLSGAPTPEPAPAPSYQPPPGPSAVPPPTNPYTQHQQPGPYGGPGYAPPPNPYAAPQEYAPPHNPYGAPYQPAYAGGTLPDHPQATTSMVLGIIGLVGIAFCGGITLVLSPAAWIVGAKAVRQIDAFPGRYAGRDRAQAGKIMGIIGTVLLALGIVTLIAVIAIVVSVGSSDPQPVFPSPSFGNGGA